MGKNRKSYIEYTISYFKINLLTSSRVLKGISRFNNFSLDFT